MRRAIILSVALAVIAISWIPVFTVNTDSQTPEIENLLVLALEQVEAGAYGAAVRLYSEVLELEDTVENRLLMSEALLSYGEKVEYIKTMRRLISRYPDLSEPYVRLANYYFELDNIPQGIKVVVDGLANGASSEDLYTMYYKYAFEYEYVGGEYVDADPFINGYAVVFDGISYRVLNASMKYISTDSYEEADNFFGNTATVKVNGNYFVIDTKGRKYMKINGAYSYVRSYSEGVAVVAKEGEIGLIDSMGRHISSGYSYISNICGGAAAAKKDEGFIIVNKDLKKRSSEVYEDIAIGADNMCSRAGRIFVKKNSSYIMINTKGIQLGDYSFDGAKAFQEGPAAVMRGDKWGFIDINGNIVIDFKYEDAQSFNNGLAAVLIDGKWGFIDISDNIVIDPIYQEAKSLSDSGLIPVKEEGKWRYIRLLWRDKFEQVLNRKS